MPDRAVEAARVVARRLGIDASEAYPLRVSFSIYVHLAPSPVAARVAVLTPLLRRDNAKWLGRELAVVGALEDLGVPVVRPIDREVHQADGLDLSLWEYVEHDPSAIPSGDEVGRLLGELHAAMRELSHGLADQRLAALDDLVMSGLSTADVDAIEAALPPRPVQVLHGDAHPGNMMQTPRGWLWHDFEETCVGPVEWDLGVLAKSRRIDGRAALRAYPAAPSYESLQPWIELRSRQVPMWEELASVIPR
jgi:Ser/Thr protein kinase RdoA (MazF antagonist)